MVCINYEQLCYVNHRNVINLLCFYTNGKLFHRFYTSYYVFNSINKFSLKTTDLGFTVSDIL